MHSEKTNCEFTEKKNESKNGTLVFHSSNYTRKEKQRKKT